MTEPSLASYCTANRHANNAALRQRGLLLILLDPKTNWLAKADGRRGRPPTFTDAAVQVCLRLKVLFGLTLRQTKGMVSSLFELVCAQRQHARSPVKDSIPYRRFTGALHLLIDSTRIRTMAGLQQSRRINHA